MDSSEYLTEATPIFTIIWKMSWNLATSIVFVLLAKHRGVNFKAAPRNQAASNTGVLRQLHVVVNIQLHPRMLLLRTCPTGAQGATHGFVTLPKHILPVSPFEKPVALGGPVSSS